MTGFKSKRAAALDEDGMYLVHHTAQELTLQEQLKKAHAERDNKKERLIRIMGTFDLATGHADTFDELLDALESELRDVLGHYRQALAQPAQEPVVWMGYERGLKMFTAQQRIADAYPEIYTVPLYPSLPQSPWVGLTDDEIKEIVGPWGDTPIKGYTRELIDKIEAKLKGKNNAA